MASVRWLDETEQAAWRALLRAHGRLAERLDRELAEEHGMSLSDYEVLVHLSEAPAGGLRMSELADRLVFSRSRLTHHVNRLEDEGLVHREISPEDRRGFLATLTAEGRRLLERAAPTHVRGVRRHLIGVLRRSELEMLGEAMRRVADQLEETAG